MLSTSSCRTPSAPIAAADRGSRRKKAAARAARVNCARKLNRTPQETPARAAARRQINRAGHAETATGQQAHRYQAQRVAHRLVPRALPVRINARQHDETRLRIFIAVHPGDGEEMRNLPEKQNREQRPPFAREFAGARRSSPSTAAKRRESRRRPCSTTSPA